MQDYWIPILANDVDCKMVLLPRDRGFGKQPLSNDLISPELIIDTKIVPVDQLTVELPRPVTFIHHMAFTGSTFLANMLNNPGISISYNEPEILSSKPYHIMKQQYCKHNEAVFFKTIPTDICARATLFDPVDKHVFVIPPLEEYIAICIDDPHHMDWIGKVCSTMCDHDTHNSDIDCIISCWNFFISEWINAITDRSIQPLNSITINSVDLKLNPIDVLKTVNTHSNVQVPMDNIRTQVTKCTSIHAKTGKSFDVTTHINTMRKRYSAIIQHEDYVKRIEQSNINLMTLTKMHRDQC